MFLLIPKIRMFLLRILLMAMTWVGAKMSFFFAWCVKSRDSVLVDYSVAVGEYLSAVSGLIAAELIPSYKGRAVERAEASARMLALLYEDTGAPCFMHLKDELERYVWERQGNAQAGY